MISTNFDYASCVRTSEKVSWKLDDVFPADRKLDFTRRFLPDAIANGGDLPFLTPAESIKLNQITGNSYLYLFYFVEEYIIASTLHHASAEMFGDEMALRALLRFAEEEVKHQQMFQRFGAAFRRDFGVECGVIENPQAVAEVILSKVPMAVLLVTLHLELVTQQHYVQCFRPGEDKLDPLFASLLKNHWIEEAQHAKIDALELQKLASHAAPAQVAAAVDDYLGILEAFAGLLGSQAKLDVESLERAVGRTFTEEERAAVEAAQARAYRRVFITLGIENPAFAKYCEQFSEEGARLVAAHVAVLS